MPAFFSQGMRWAQKNALGKVIKEKQSVVVQISFILMVILYMLFGSVMFMVLEGDLLWSDVGNDTANGTDSDEFSDEQQACLIRALDNVSMSIDDTADQMALCIFDVHMVVDDPWAEFGTAVMFTFTVITTIGTVTIAPLGYGHIAPVTPLGRFVCCVYGLIGIPLAMMTVANIGKALMEVLTKLANRLQKHIDRWTLHWKSRGLALRVDIDQNTEIDELTATKTDESLTTVVAGGVDTSTSKTSLAKAASGSKAATVVEDEFDEELSNAAQSILILFTFLVYIVFGSLIMNYYEDGMTVFNGIYFNFVTLTTVGLGDMVPKSNSMLWFTIAYVTIGLALTTMAIEIASEYLRKMHHYGRKMANPANAYVWFGGKRIQVGTLMRNLGEMYGIDELKDGGFDILNEIVDVALDKEENPDKYPKRCDSTMSSDHYSVKPKHLSSTRDIREGLPYVDSEEETSHMDGIYGML